MSTIRQELNKNDDSFETIRITLNFLFIFSLIQTLKMMKRWRNMKCYKVIRIQIKNLSF